MCDSYYSGCSCGFEFIALATGQHKRFSTNRLCKCFWRCPELSMTVVISEVVLYKNIPTPMVGVTVLMHVCVLLQKYSFCYRMARQCSCATVWTLCCCIVQNMPRLAKWVMTLFWFWESSLSKWWSGTCSSHMETVALKIDKEAVCLTLLSLEIFSLMDGSFHCVIFCSHGIGTKLLLECNIWLKNVWLYSRHLLLYDSVPVTIMLAKLWYLKVRA